jgi:hypothetical protein
MPTGPLSKLPRVSREEVGVGNFVANLQRQAVDAERRASGLRKMIEVANDLGEEGVKELLALVANGNDNGTPHADVPTLPLGGPDTPPAGGPRGREAIRLIVAERPGVWTLAMLREEMRVRGWFTSRKALETAVVRLARDGEARRVGKGRYEFPLSVRPDGDAP